MEENENLENKNINKKITFLFICLFFVILLGGFCFMFYSENPYVLALLKPSEEIYNAPKILEEEVSTTQDFSQDKIVYQDDMPEDLKNDFIKNYNINHDYVGRVVFDSGLIDQPIVQAKSVYDENGKFRKFYNRDGKIQELNNTITGNDVYLYMNWQTEKYDLVKEGASVFMDYRNNISSDQNIIVYGHHFSVAAGNDPNRNKRFTPLEKLLDKKNYKDNNTLKLYLENEVREYKVVAVYKFDVYNYDDVEYFRTNYDIDYYDKKDEGYYERYIQGIKDNQLYETGEVLTVNDKTLTLQTCIAREMNDKYDDKDYKEIVVCKETRRIIFKNPIINHELENVRPKEN